MTKDPLHQGGSLFDFTPLVQGYDRWYATPVGSIHDRVQKQDVRKLLLPALPHQQLLDVGCGTGHWSEFFASMGYRVTGVDILAEMIKVARSRVPNCEFNVADVCDLPFENEAFDVVGSMAVLEFVSDPASAVGEMVRCTKSGGSLLIGTLNRLAPLNQQRLSQESEPYASGHLLSPDELREMLQPYGKVRMIASPVEQREDRTLSGAFIVAEVRR